MNINSPTGYSASVVTQLMTMRTNLEDLQRQFGTGMKSTTYGGLGNERSLAISFRTRLETVSTYQQTIDVLGIRLSTTTASLTHMQSIIDETRKALDPNSFTVLADGLLGQQKTAYNALADFVGLLNTDVAGRYMFGGRKTDSAPVESVDKIMDGYGNQAGFTQVTNERRQADQGDDGLGRLDVSVAATDVTIAEDGSHPFGFKLQAVTSTLANATITDPIGAPPAATVSFTGQPEAGQTLKLTLRMPDGSDTTIELSAGTETDLDSGTFAIGATPDDTAANFAAAVTAELGRAARTDLVTASAIQASSEFFDTAGGNPPMRVDGPPFDTATGLVAGTEDDTVAWYKGENTPPPSSGWSPRQDVQARVDGAVTAAYGMRANEQAFTWSLKQFAVMAAVDLSAGGDDEKAIASSMQSKLKQNLASPPGTETLTAVHMEIALAQKTADRAADRHTQTTGMLEGYLADIEQVDKNEVGVKLLSLQTSMEATYQATSILYKLSLTNYL